MAFEGSAYLQHIELPDSVRYIGNDAFRNCNLIDLVIPYKLVTLGDRAFAYNENLSRVYFESDITNLGSDVFLKGFGEIINVYYPDNTENLNNAFGLSTSLNIIEYTPKSFFDYEFYDGFYARVMNLNNGFDRQTIIMLNTSTAKER